MKPVLMIHEVTEELFKLPLADYTLTFDDGTACHYEYFDRLKQIETEKIFFIITDYIGKPGYLTLDQLKEISEYCTIGGHSHEHIDLREMPNLAVKANHVLADSQKMVDWFNSNLGKCPTVFCYPYNYDINGLYSTLLRKWGFTEFYGRERIPVETLLQPEHPLADPYTLAK